MSTKFAATTLPATMAISLAAPAGRAANGNPPTPPNAYAAGFLSDARVA